MGVAMATTSAGASDAQSPLEARALFPGAHAVVTSGAWAGATVRVLSGSGGGRTRGRAVPVRCVLVRDAAGATPRPPAPEKRLRADFLGAPRRGAALGGGGAQACAQVRSQGGGEGSQSGGEGGAPVEQERAAERQAEAHGETIELDRAVAGALAGAQNGRALDVRALLGALAKSHPSAQPQAKKEAQPPAGDGAEALPTQQQRGHDDAQSELSRRPRTRAEAEALRSSRLEVAARNREAAIKLVAAQRAEAERLERERDNAARSLARERALARHGADAGEESAEEAARREAILAKRETAARAAEAEREAEAQQRSRYLRAAIEMRRTRQMAKAGAMAERKKALEEENNTRMERAALEQAVRGGVRAPLAGTVVTGPAAGAAVDVLQERQNGTVLKVRVVRPPTGNQGIPVGAVLLVQRKCVAVTCGFVLGSGADGGEGAVEVPPPEVEAGAPAQRELLAKAALARFARLKTAASEPFTEQVDEQRPSDDEDSAVVPRG